MNPLSGRILQPPSHPKSCFTGYSIWAPNSTSVAEHLHRSAPYREALISGGGEHSRSHARRNCTSRFTASTVWSTVPRLYGVVANAGGVASVHCWCACAPRTHRGNQELNRLRRWSLPQLWPSARGSCCPGRRAWRRVGGKDGGGGVLIPLGRISRLRRRARSGWGRLDPIPRHLEQGNRVSGGREPGGWHCQSNICLLWGRRCRRDQQVRFLLGFQRSFCSLTIHYWEAACRTGRKSILVA